VQVGILHYWNISLFSILLHWALWWHMLSVLFSLIYITGLNTSKWIFWGTSCWVLTFLNDNKVWWINPRPICGWWWWWWGWWGRCGMVVNSVLQLYRFALGLLYLFFLSPLQDSVLCVTSDTYRIPNLMSFQFEEQRTPVCAKPW